MLPDQPPHTLSQIKGVGSTQHVFLWDTPLDVPAPAWELRKWSRFSWKYATC